MDIRLWDEEEKKDLQKKVTNATYVRQSSLHKILVDIVYDFLMKEVEETEMTNINHVSWDSGLYKEIDICLTTGEHIRADIVNQRKRIVYEVHVKGERKGKYFDKLPDGWKGVNIFYDEEENEETLLIKLGTNEIKRIKWKNEVTN